jgi:hypothetical protein
MSNEVKIKREIDEQAEVFYEDAKRLGKIAFRAIGVESRHRAQMTGLESIAESTQKVSDIFDYIKKQTARHDYWRKENFGQQLKDYLECDLANKCNVICSSKRLDIGNTKDEDKLQRRQIHLQLIRQFIRQMVVHYEYLVAFPDEAGNDGA